MKSCIDDLGQIAECHCKAFPHSLSTALGPRYLRSMFRWYLENDQTFLLHINYRGKCVGYCGGLVKKEAGTGSTSGMIQFTFFDAVKSLALRPWLVLHREVRRHYLLILRNILKMLFHTQNSPNDFKGEFQPYVGLVVIGVDPTNQGKGFGSRLLHEFDLKVKSLGFERSLLSVRSGNTAAISVYKRNGWEIVRDNGNSTVMQKLTVSPILEA